MDSFTCGTCHKTFHVLEDFVLHKQTHDSQNVSKTSSKSENGLGAAGPTTKCSGSRQSPLPSNLASISSSLCNSPNTVCASSNFTPAMKFQSHSCISDIKRVFSSSDAKLSATGRSQEKVAQLNKLCGTNYSVSPRIGGKDGKGSFLKRGEATLSVLDRTYKSSSKAARYRIDNDGHLQKFSDGCDKTEAIPSIPPSSSKKTEDLSLRNLEGLRSENHLSDSGKVYPDYNSENIMEEEKEIAIQIFESGSETVLLGQLILEDNSKDVVRIEISEETGSTDRIGETTSGVLLNSKSVYPSVYGSCVDSAVEISSEGGRNLKVSGDNRREEHLDIQVSFVESCLSDSVINNSDNNENMVQMLDSAGNKISKTIQNCSDESRKNSENENSILSSDCRNPQTPRIQGFREIQEKRDNTNKGTVEVDAIPDSRYSSIKETYRSEIRCVELMDMSNEAMKHKNNDKSSALLENENDKIDKMADESNADKSKELGRWFSLDEGVIIPQSGCETSVLNDEGMELVASNIISSSSEWNDSMYASAPGLYTLLLNADNTFTLVAGGYQGSSSGQNSRIFVCQLCRKFTQSQVELLNHISVSHPEDLDDVNRCVGEFSLLAPSVNENGEAAGDTSHVLMSADTQGPKNSVNESLSRLLPENANCQTCQDITCTEPRRKVRKKLGRPRKEDQVRVESQNQERNVKSGFIKEGEGMTCVNCHKYFVKYRQYDKHRCSMWKDSLLHSEEWDNTSAMPKKEGNVEEYDPYDESKAHFGFTSFVEDDLEEEWKVNKRFKPKVKIKAGGDERRKRGRLPKVDVLASRAVISDSSQNGKDEMNLYHTTSHENNNKEMFSLCLPEAVTATVSSAHAPGSNPPLLASIPTLPVFSNACQQERLHKWIAQTDLSFVDCIIDKLSPGEGDLNHHETEMYRCQKCQVMFRSLLACRRHCAKHMSRKAFACPDCDFATANVGVLYNHYRNHTQNLYACNKCDFRARIKSHMRDHLETHYPSRYICRLCQKPYSTSNSLRSHIYLYHANNDGTKYLWSLRKKNQDRSSKDVFYQCPVCGKLFGERSSANRHLASHAPSVPKVLIKCEVCGTESLNKEAFKKHMLKHKVVYICCICNEPQVTANSLRNHQKGSSCQSSRPGESFKQSILLSFTSTDTFPSLLDNKRIGPLIQDVKNSPRKESAYIKLKDGLIKQMQEIGYKQIFQLLQEKEQLCQQGDEAANKRRDIMKIVVDTGCVEESKQLIAWNQQHEVEEHVDHQHEESMDQTIHYDTKVKSEHSEYRPEAMFSGRQSDQELTSYTGNRTENTESPIYLRDQDPKSGESDQRVVVISNIGEEQTVVVEDGQVVMMEEERFVIISDECVPKQPINFAKFFGDAD